VAAKKFIEMQQKEVVNHTVQFVSYNLMDAVDKIRYISMMAHGIPEKRRKKIAFETKTSIEFLDSNGRTTSRLVSIACRPPRGKPGDVVLDECAIYGSAKSRIIYTAALPSITRGGSIIIGSTPLGTSGIFHEIYTNKKDYPDYRRYTIPWWHSTALCKEIDKAREAGVRNMDTDERVRRWGKKILKQEFAALDMESFRQEFECTFLDGSESYISLDLIYANTPGKREGDRSIALDHDGMGEDENEHLEIKVFKTADELLADAYRPEKHGHLLYMGYDVARRRDAAVIFIIGVLPNGKKVSVAHIEMINRTFEYQRDQVRKIMRSGLPVVRCCIDQGGLGEDTTETLQREFSTTRIEGVMFNTESKAELAMGIREGLEKREFLLQDDGRFHRQIHSIKRIPTSGYAFRYDSERDEMGHADSFWAWALANYAIPRSSATERKGFYRQYREKRTGTVSTPKSAVAEPVERERPKGKSLRRALREMGLK